jgi:hypothetical protein
MIIIIKIKLPKFRQELIHIRDTLSLFDFDAEILNEFTIFVSFAICLVYNSVNCISSELIFVCVNDSEGYFLAAESQLCD